MEDAHAQRPQSERKATHEAGPYEQAATHPDLQDALFESDGLEQADVLFAAQQAARQWQGAQQGTDADAAAKAEDVEPEAERGTKRQGGLAGRLRFRGRPLQAAYHVESEAQKRAEAERAAQLADEEWTAKSQADAAVQRPADPRAPGLSVSRELVKASNAAAAALEAEAAYSRLSALDLPFFQEQARLEQERYLAEMMVAAGRGLLDSFTNLIKADDVWDRLANTERTIGQKLVKTAYSFRSRVELAELLTHHIPETLLALGYHPPPPAEEWTGVVQDSVHRLLTVSQENVPLARNSARARQELIFFTWRLRSLVEAAERSLNENEQTNKSPYKMSPSAVRAAVAYARKKAIPAALAAGARAAVTGGITGGPAAMAVGLLSGGAASLLASVTEAAATAWLAEADAPVVPPSLTVRIDIEALDGCIEMIRSATSYNIENVRFIIRRGVFQTLQDAADSSIPIRDFLWDWSKELLSLLDDKAFSVTEAHQIVDRARARLANPAHR